MINTLLCKANYIKTNFQSDKNSKYNLDSVIKYSSEAVQLIKNETTLKNKQTIAKAYFNHGYFLFSLKHNAEGKLFLDKALSIAQKYHFGNYIARYYGTLGVYAQDERQFDLAKNYFLKGLNELHNLAYTDPDLSLDLYNSLRLLAAQQSNNWNEYKIWDDKYNETFAEVNKQETQNSINAAIVKYDLKQKEEKIQLLTEKNNFKFWLIISLTALFFVGLITLYFYRKSQKIKWLLIQEHNKALEKEKTDTQKELLSSILHLEKKNEILNNIKEKLMMQNKEKPATINNTVFKIIDEGILVDDDFEKFKSNFNPIYPDFFNQLQQQSNQSFTQLDLKYCAFILMKLSNKEIAQQLNIEPKSVRMARYRIKQKLNLNKDEDLDNYIQKAAKNI